MIKFVQGGSTGLEQQKAKRYPTPKKKEGIKKEIKDGCKYHGEDLVIMQIGSFYVVIEEDAEYFHNEYKFKYKDTWEDIYLTGFPLSQINLWKNTLIRQGEKDFCIVEEVSKKEGKKILREVTFSSSNKKSLGLVFAGGIKK